MAGEMVTQSDVGLVVEKVEAALGKLADTMGQGAEHFWPVLVRQQLMTAYVGIGLWVLTLLLWVFFFATLTRAMRKGGWEKDDREGLAVLSAIFGVVLFALLVLAFGLGFKGATMVFNPEYHALMDVLKAVK